MVFKFIDKKIISIFIYYTYFDTIKGIKIKRVLPVDLEL